LISNEAYSRLASLKRLNESFTDVINRLVGKRSLLELAGILTGREAEELRRSVGEVRAPNRK
jgi:predicted CopG family antitoxin